MRYIVLVGKDQTGKTTTINEVIFELLNNGATIVDKKAGHKFKTYVSSSSQLPANKSINVTIVLSLSGKLIGVTSYGDAESFIQSKVDFFRNVGCTHAVFASHPSGSSYEYLVKLADMNGFNDFHAVFKVGCVGITATQTLQNASDGHAKNEIIHWISI